MGSFYEDRILPHVIDLACGTKVFTKARSEIVPRASGRVLEIGMGTGHNLPHYNKDNLSCLCGVDPGLHPKAEKRAKEAGIAVDARPITAEAIPVEDASYDTVVSTFTLCTIPDAEKALAEVRRVLAPGGKLLFVEHGEAPDENVRRWQNRINPYWGKVAGGCNINRNMEKLISGSGFAIDELKKGYKPGPKIATFLYSGLASVR